MKHLASLFFFFIVCFNALAQAVDLPPPPAGYSWTNCIEIKGAFLKPDNWFFKKVVKDSGAVGYFLSKQNIEELGSFTTGLSVNVTINARVKRGAPEYAAAFIGVAAKAHKVLVEPWQRKMGPFHQFGVRTLVPDQKGGDYITHILAIGNEETGTVYILRFEAPVDTWEADWKLGEPMLSKFLIETEI